MNEKSISIAIDRYDRHLPLFLGSVSPPRGYRPEYLEVGMDPPRRHGVNRHRRMLVEREFDVAEVSLASYLVARDKGMTDMVALPVFPRRLFSQNHVFVSERSGIRQPAELAGKRVAVWAFQVTMSVLARGDLQRDYGVDWRTVTWLTENNEEIQRDYGKGVRIERLEDGFDVMQGLVDGQLDACINPHPPECMMTPGRGVRRLFPDWQDTNSGYYRRHGYYPIMHVLAVRSELLEADPALAGELVRVFDEAKGLARQYYVDPGFSTVMHARNTLEYELEHLSPDPWPSGLAANRQNLEDFIGYCVDQRLLEKEHRVDELFFS